MAFEVNQVFPGVSHIRDEMGVCMTLLTGSDRALLIDTGYGTEDVHAFVRTLTDLPLTVVLTHSHHDHAMGARWFGEVHLFADDCGTYEEFTGTLQRQRVLVQAQSKGIEPAEDFMTAVFPEPVQLQEGEVDLGGLTGRVIRCPGHTPGSAVVYVPQYRLLLTGDDWNPCTWLFFEAALGAQEYRKNVRKLFDLPFEHVLCSHQLQLYPRETMERFITALTDDVLRSAEKVSIPPYTHIDTRQAQLPENQIFVFDYAKAELRGESLS